jgi:pectate lyase
VSNSSDSKLSSSETESSSSSEETAALMANVRVQHLAVSVEGRTLSIQGAVRTVYLLDAQGKLVAKVHPTGNVSSIAVPRAGSYLFRIGNELHRVVVR